MYVGSTSLPLTIFYQLFTDVGVLLFLALYIFWKIKQKSEVWKPEEMNFTAVSLTDQLHLILKTDVRPIRGSLRMKRLKFPRFLLMVSGNTWQPHFSDGPRGEARRSYSREIACGILAVSDWFGHLIVLIIEFVL